jgi:zinc transport system substrate-binding protein
MTTITTMPMARMIRTPGSRPKRGGLAGCDRGRTVLRRSGQRRHVFRQRRAAKEELAAVSAEVNAILDPVRGLSFVVFHDAYQYFETAFDFPASGAISIGDAVDPSPARIAEIQGRVADEGIQCVLSEPQFDPGLVATVMDGTEANTAVLDPLGSDLEPGPDLYPQLLRNLATSLAGCL